MKKSSIILVIISLVLAAGMFAAGCVSDSGTGQAQSASVTTTLPSAGQDATPSMQAGNMSAQPSGTPPEGMAEGNMTRPEMSGTPPEGMQSGNMTGPSGTPPSGTPPSGTPQSGT